MSKSFKTEFSDGLSYGDYIKLEVHLGLTMNEKDQETLNEIVKNLDMLSQKYLKQEA